MEESGEPGENHRPVEVTDKLYHIEIVFLRRYFYFSLLMMIQPYSLILARKWETINDPFNGQHKLKLQFQNNMPVLSDR